MAQIDVSNLSYGYPGLDLVIDSGFSIKQGEKVGIVGPNGAGKTTLLNVLSKDHSDFDGNVRVDGALGILSQFHFQNLEGITLREFVMRFVPSEVQKIAAQYFELESRIEKGELDGFDWERHATLVNEWNNIGGYQIEASLDAICTRILGESYQEIQNLDVTLLSGGQQKRVVLAILLESNADVLLLDEPDNALDIEGKTWLEEQLISTPKTVVLVSHDRALLSKVPTKLIAVEAKEIWTHDGNFSTYESSRIKRFEDIEEVKRRWEEKRVALKKDMEQKRLWAEKNAKNAPKYHASKTRFEKHLQSRPRALSLQRRIAKFDYKASRSGDRVAVIENLGFDGLFSGFDNEIFNGDRICVIGSNGSGKSHLLSIFSEARQPHKGTIRIGPATKVGFFQQSHHFKLPSEEDLLTTLSKTYGATIDEVGKILNRYELGTRRFNRFDELSGGQKARLQFAAIALQKANFLVLDEPTDNLDMQTAEALERFINDFEGAVLAVSHDRWFISLFNRFWEVEDKEVRELEDLGKSVSSVL